MRRPFPAQAAQILEGGGGFTVGAEGEAALIDSAWTTVAPMTTARQAHTATLLTVAPFAGQVLVAGGTTTGNTALSSVERYDPGTNSWTQAPLPPAMSTARSGHTATTLQDGRVLVTGGKSTVVLATAEIYDPATNSWTSAGTMSTARQSHTATLLTTGPHSGGVLVTGGTNGTAIQSSAEIYDPATNSWSSTPPPPPMSSARQFHTATRLQDGKVLVAAGRNAAAVVNTAEVYDPVANSWTPTQLLSSARELHTATLLTSGPNSGDVLVVGGRIGATEIGVTERYHPTSNSWLPTLGSLNAPRHLHAAAALGGGQVLAIGGFGIGSTFLSSVELYDPAADTWATHIPLAGARDLHAATLLQDGRVLVTGGLLSGTVLSSAELYTLSATGATPCGFAADCQSGFCVDGFCCDGACGGLCQACSAAKKGQGADGVCGPIQAGTDPDNECALQPQSSCGTTGDCDGVGACQFYADGTVSAPAVCMGNTLKNADLCDGKGQIISGGTQSCGALLCVNLSCPTPCTTDAQCNATSSYCDGTTCVAKLALGAPCAGAHQCQTGNCVDGVCCSSACNGGVCDACSKAAGATADGTCTPLNGVSCDDGNPCTQLDTCQGFACTGGSPLQCATPDQCHLGGVCDPQSGTCVYEAKPNGTPCDDGNACTQADACQAGVCTGDAPVICKKDECQLSSTCNPANGACVVTFKLDGAPCPGGTCIAGGCFIESTPDAGSTSGSAGGGSSGTGTTENGSGGTSSGGAGSGGAGSGASSSGSGTGAGTPSTSSAEDGIRLHGGGCGSSSGRDAGSAPWVGLGLLLAARARRRALKGTTSPVRPPP